MNKKEMNIFAVIGGDMRQAELASALRADGKRVRLFGFDSCSADFTGIEKCDDIRYAVTGADCIILPLPCSSDGVRLNAPLCSSSPKLSEIYAAISKSSIIFGGKIDERMLRSMGFTAYDYFKREELAILNAIPTAEGAIQLAMEQHPKTIHSSKCLVVGYGRIGKALSNMLKALNADVTVSVRKYSDEALVRSNGMTAARTSDIADIIGGFDIVFNTVPTTVITRKELLNADPELLIIDLASKPGGIDFDEARICGINTLWALSLPGKVACRTAGEIIKQTVLNIISEEALYGKN